MMPEFPLLRRLACARTALLACAFLLALFGCDRPSDAADPGGAVAAQHTGGSGGAEAPAEAEAQTEAPAAPAAAQDANDGIHRNEAAGFSIRQPDGWNVARIAGLEHPVIAGPAADGFAPNLVFVVEPTGPDMGLDDYLAANREALDRFMPTARIGESEAMEANSGERFYRLIATTEQQALHLRQTFYMFQKGDRAITITASALAAGGEALDDTFLGAVRTFAW